MISEEWWQMPELQTGERDILRHLEIGLDDVIQDQTAEIEVEPDMSIANDIDEGLNLGETTTGLVTIRFPLLIPIGSISLTSFVG